MIPPPRLGPVDAHIFNGSSLGYALAVDRDGEPLFALCSLDLVAVAPAVLVILHIIVEDKQIGAADLIKITAPRNIRRLQNNDVHFPAVSLTTYVGLSMLRSNIRARYSPNIPRAKSCAPLNRAMMDAKNGKPGKLPT